MTFANSEIELVTEHYHFLKILPEIQSKNKIYRKKSLEKQARKAIMNFSKHNVHSLTNYWAEEQSEMVAWIHLAISECNKIKKQDRVDQ